MKTFAPHLDGLEALLASAERCRAAAVALMDMRLLGSRRKTHLWEAHDAFVGALDEGLRAGLSEPDARLLLEDGVNLVMTLWRAMLGLPRQNAQAMKAASKILTEFKPHRYTHHGFRLNERVGLQSGGFPYGGTVIALDPFNNDEGQVLTDDGREMDVRIEWLHHQPMYGRVPREAARAA